MTEQWGDDDRPVRLTVRGWAVLMGVVCGAGAFVGTVTSGWFWPV